MICACVRSVIIYGSEILVDVHIRQEDEISAMELKNRLRVNMRKI